jgi:hypothetical protein
MATPKLTKTAAASLPTAVSAKAESNDAPAPAAANGAAANALPPNTTRLTPHPD